MRPPRRSERFPSLVRVDTINGKPADEVSEGTRFDDLPVAFPAERLELGSDDPTVKAIEWLTPFGKGSRVSVVGPARAGKSEALRRIAAALADKGGVELTVVLAGVRPEEVPEWQSGPAVPAAAVTFAASADAQGQAVEHAVEQARRVAARGADAVVIIDSLEYVSPAVARRALAAARNIADGGSLTVIASTPVPLGGETTVIALDAALTAMGRFPALDLALERDDAAGAAGGRRGRRGDRQGARGHHRGLLTQALLGLPLARVHDGSELVLEFGALRSPIASAPEHLVGEWRVRAEDWELLDGSDWEPVIGAAVVAVKKNGLRFSSGHVLRVSGGWTVERG